MSKTLFIRKPVASLESELMDADQHAAQVAEQAVETQAMEHEVETDIEESESTVASLESRMEQLELISAFAGKPIQSFEQAQLTTALAYSAVQGTDLDVHRDVFGKTPTQFNQSFENDGGLTFSAEAIGETLKDMGKATLEKLKQAGKWLYELIVKIFNMFRSKEARVKNLKALVEKGREASKVKDGQEIRLTGSQVANVGTVSEYSELMSIFSKLNGESPKYAQLLDVIEKEATNAFTQLNNSRAYFTPKSINNVASAASTVVTSYEGIFKLKYTSGTGDEPQAISPLIGKKKIKATKKKVEPVKEKDGSESIVVADHVESIKFSLVKDENLPESMMVPVLSISDLQNLIPDLEKAITGKVMVLKDLERLAKHRIFSGKVFEWGGEDEKAKQLGRDLSQMGRIVRDSVIQPHGLFATTFQSVTDDYLRYSEVSAKLHASGKEEKAEEQTGSTELATA